MKRGNCYVVSEALYHILGGPTGPWKPCRMRTKRDTHWFLRHRVTGQVLDASRLQFGTRLPDYQKAVGSGFLTKTPSKRARALMEQMTWQQ